MSVTKHAHRKGARDDFETPGHATRALLAHPEVAAIVARSDAQVIEHAAGHGAILQALRAAGVARERLTAVEIAPECRRDLEALAATVDCPRDSRTLPDAGLYDLAVTNPPFAEDGVAVFTRIGLRLVRPGGLVAIYARHDWIVPETRDAVLLEIGYPDVCATVRRAAFIRLAKCDDCGGRWTYPASGPPRFAHPRSMDRPGGVDQERVRSCLRVGEDLPAPKSSDTNAYAWLLWRRGEVRAHGVHMRLREAR